MVTTGPSGGWLRAVRSSPCQRNRTGRLFYVKVPADRASSNGAESGERRAERRERRARSPAIGHARSVTTRTSARLHHRNTSAPVPPNDRHGAARRGELVQTTVPSVYYGSAEVSKGASNLVAIFRRRARTPRPAQRGGSAASRRRPMPQAPSGPTRGACSTSSAWITWRTTGQAPPDRPCGGSRRGMRGEPGRAGEDGPPRRHRCHSCPSGDPDSFAAASWAF
jgi:hypothetical protein